MKTKRFPLHPEPDELFKKLHPVLLDIFCNGAIKIEPWKWILAALSSIPFIPFNLVISVVKRSIHLLILFFVWLVLRVELDLFPTLEKIMLFLAVLAIFYKDIYDEIISLLLDLSIIVTQGKFIRWLCEGYLSGEGIRHASFAGRHVERLVAGSTPLLPSDYRLRYDKMINLYMESNKRESEKKLWSGLAGSRLQRLSCR